MREKEQKWYTSFDLDGTRRKPLGQLKTDGLELKLVKILLSKTYPNEYFSSKKTPFYNLYLWAWDNQNKTKLPYNSNKQALLIHLAIYMVKCTYYLIHTHIWFLVAGLSILIYRSWEMQINKELNTSPFLSVNTISGQKINMICFQHSCPSSKVWILSCKHGNSLPFPVEVIPVRGVKLKNKYKAKQNKM